MGCLCATLMNDQQKTITRRNTYSLNAECTDVYYKSFTGYRKFKSEYKIQPKPIGLGSLGKVYLCNQITTNKLFAVKVISKAGLSTEYLKNNVIENQVKIIQELNHPSILKIFDFFYDLNNFYIVMEYVKGGDLVDKVTEFGCFTEQVAANVMKQIFCSLGYLHNKGIVHRDVKCENILIEENNKDLIIKLIDFDTISKLNPGEKLKGWYGTVYYMAPELISGSYTEKCDIWSAGIVLYSLITQNFPFGGENENIIMRSIKNFKGDKNLMKKHKISNELNHFILCLLNPDPEKRLSAQEASSHPWIQKFTTLRVPKTLKQQIFDQQSNIRQALKIWALKTIIPSFELAEYQMMFINMDQDLDGLIKIGQLVQGNENEYCEKIVKVFDCCGNQGLNFHEFASFLVPGEVIRKYSDQILEELDKDKSGKLSIKHLMMFLEEYVKVDDWSGNEDNNGEITNSEIMNLISV